MNHVSTVAWWLIIVGALNWGLMAFDMNLVESVFGSMGLANVVYALVGLAGLWTLWEKFGTK